MTVPVRKYQCLCKANKKLRKQNQKTSLLQTNWQGTMAESINRNPVVLVPAVTVIHITSYNPKKCVELENECVPTIPASDIWRAVSELRRNDCKRFFAIWRLLLSTLNKTNDTATVPRVLANPPLSQKNQLKCEDRLQWLWKSNKLVQTNDVLSLPVVICLFQKSAEQFINVERRFRNHEGGTKKTQDTKPSSIFYCALCGHYKDWVVKTKLVKKITN